MMSLVNSAKFLWKKNTEFLSNLPQKTDEEEILPNSCMKPASFNTKPHKDIANKQTHKPMSLINLYMKNLNKVITN